MKSQGERPNRRLVSEWTLERLYDLVFSGTLGPGATVREEQLTTLLGVSRSPVRMSLHQLEIDGLLEIDPVSGRRSIARIGPKDVYGLYTIRAALEEVSVAHAATRATPAVLAELEDLEAAIEESLSGGENGDQVFVLDIKFHQRICDISGLTRLKATLSPLWLQTRVLLRYLRGAGLYNDEEELLLAYKDHRDIMAALKAKDAHLAANTVRHHLHERRDYLIATLQKERQKGTSWPVPNPSLAAAPSTREPKVPASSVTPAPQIGPWTVVH